MAMLPAADGHAAPPPDARVFHILGQSMLVGVWDRRNLGALLHAPREGPLRLPANEENLLAYCIFFKRFTIFRFLLGLVLQRRIAKFDV